MRFAVTTALLLLWPILAASAQLPTSGNAPVPGQTYDIPSGSAPQSVSIIRREIAPGEIGPLHTHPGVEMTYVAQGDFEVWVGTAAPHIYHMGESVMIPRGLIHQSKNIGSMPVVTYTTLVLDQGKPARISVSGPALAH